MKTNVSIKFNSIEEYREIERVLEGSGYVNDKRWNDSIVNDLHFRGNYNVFINRSKKFFIVHNNSCRIENIYNSLQEFLNENEN